MKKKSPDKIRTIEEKFFSSIKRGTGEAILLIKRYPYINFDKFILRACRHSFAYDPQCEDREHYFYEIIKLSKRREILETQLIRSLKRARKNTWDTIQLSGLAELFASNGNTEAREALYERHSKFLADSAFEYVDRIAYGLINLDGLKGLKFAAEVEGRRLLADPDTWSDDRLFSSFKDVQPDVDPRKALSKEAKENKYVKRYLDEVADSYRRYKAHRRSRPTYASIKKLIESDARVPITIGKCISKGVMKKLDRDFVNESDKNKILKYLKVFAWADYSFDIEVLMKYAVSSNAEIRRAAVRVLEKTRDERVRQLIEKTHKSGRKLIDYLPLLVKNFRETDHSLLLRLLKDMKNQGASHWIISDIVDIYKENPSKKACRALLEIYNLTNCSVCRKHSLEVLIHTNTLPQKIAKESMYDAEKDIRAMAKEYLLKKKSLSVS